MNLEKKNVLIAFLTGLVLGGISVSFLLWPSLPSLLALPCDVKPSEYLNTTNFGIKIIDPDAKLPKARSGEVQQQHLVNLQWRCDVKNSSKIPLRYNLKTELLDKDAFVLSTTIYDSQNGQGDLPPGQVHTVFDNVILEFNLAKALASSRITPTALKTNDQIEQERSQILAQQEQAAQVLQAERKAMFDEVIAKWKEIKAGMSKSEVEVILGQPKTVRTYSSIGDVWIYPRIDGSYTTPQVKFTPTGEVKGWQMP